MRLGVVCVPGANAHYRAIEPMKAMARRGHEIVWPPDNGHADPARLRGCDVVHVYRLTGARTRQVLGELAGRGTAIVYDNDDDYTTVPKESPRYKGTGGFAGQQVFAETVKMARLAQSFTTTNEVLAEKYQRSGVKRVKVIGNYLAADLDRPRPSHGGVVVGWVAGMEHLADVARIPIREALGRLVATHDDVRVKSIGVNLGLPERYEHVEAVEFLDLARINGGFDIGIAPLADIPCSWARSDIKLKEYAASGVPWLASPIGPYRDYGEKQGGRLVQDDRWFEELDRLVSGKRERRRLARKAKSWAKDQTIDAVADRWEQVFLEAAG
jgi:glycosyltransferase involved in cell wall biosynthesis